MAGTTIDPLHQSPLGRYSAGVIEGGSAVKIVAIPLLLALAAPVGAADISTHVLTWLAASEERTYR